MRSKPPENQTSLFAAESKPKVQSDEEHFQDERRSGIGGSDVGALYNLDMGCRRKLFYSKDGKAEDFKRIESPEMERGIMVESVARAMYERRTGRKVKLMPLARHPLYDHMIVHVDGEVESPTKPGPGYAEFKVVNRFIMKRFKKEGVRDSYILQLQHGMNVKGYRWGSFGLLCLDPWQFEWFDVDEDADIQSKLVTDEQEFWNNLKAGIVPVPLEDLKDRRCMTCPYRRSCRGEEFLASLPDSGEKGELVQRDDLAPLIQEAVELGELKGQAAELEAEARDRLKAEIGEAYGIKAPGFRALLPTSYPERWDTNALKGLQSEAKALLDKDVEAWDLSALEDRCTELLQVVIGLTKAKKAAKPERALRIYPTGD